MTLLRAKGDRSDFQCGKIVMPPELAQYIRLFDVFVSTSRLQVCMFLWRPLDREFYGAICQHGHPEKFLSSFLTGMGVPVEITANVPFETGGEPNEILCQV